MNSFGLLIALSVLVLVPATGVQAGGLAGGQQGLFDAARSIAGVEPTHGCHQQYSRGLQGWHRHGADCALRRDLVEGKKRKRI